MSHWLGNAAHRMARQGHGRLGTDGQQWQSSDVGTVPWEMAKGETTMDSGDPRSCPGLQDTEDGAS